MSEEDIAELPSEAVAQFAARQLAGNFTAQSDATTALLLIQALAKEIDTLRAQVLG